MHDVLCRLHAAVGPDMVELSLLAQAYTDDWGCLRCLSPILGALRRTALGVGVIHDWIFLFVPLCQTVASRPPTPHRYLPCAQLRMTVRAEHKEEPCDRIRPTRWRVCPRT